MDGEAFFEVEKVADKPFIVRTKDADVNADNLEELKPQIYPVRSERTEVYSLLAKVQATVEPHDWAKVNTYCQKVIDAGWFTKKAWDREAGDWQTNRKTFPVGLGAVADHIRSRGMTFGLWFELESFGVNRICLNSIRTGVCNTMANQWLP